MEKNYTAQEAAQKIFELIEKANAGGAFKTLQQLDEYRGAFYSLAIAAGVEFSQDGKTVPEKKVSDGN